MLVSRNDGFRSQQEKTQLASRLTSGGGQKPEFEAMKSMGLDGAEYYTVRQLWNNNKFTKSNIVKVL